MVGSAAAASAVAAQLTNERFIAAAALITGCDTIEELAADTPAPTEGGGGGGGSTPVQIVIDALYDDVGVKLDFFTKVCKVPSLPPDAFLTSNSLSPAINLSQIANRLPEARRPYVLGLRFWHISFGTRKVDNKWISLAASAGAYPWPLVEEWARDPVT